jgi:hypothetical protein
VQQGADVVGFCLVTRLEAPTGALSPGTRFFY